MNKPLPPSALCAACHYSLRGLTTRRCPECGRPFDHADERTFNSSGLPLSRFRRRLLWMPAWPLLVITAALLAVQFWLERFPSGIRLPQMRWLWYAWAGAGLWWAAVQVLVPVMAIRLPVDLRPRLRLWLLLVPAFAAVAFVGAYHDWGFWVCYTLSRPSLNNLAAEAHASFPVEESKPRWIGAYKPELIVSNEQLVLLKISSDQCFAYAPGGLPAWLKGVRIISTPLAARDWFLLTGSLPASTLKELATDDACRQLILRPRTSPQAIHYLVSLIRRPNPRRYYYFDEALGTVGRYRGTIRLDVQALVRTGPASVGPLAEELSAGGPATMNCLGTLGLLGPVAAPAAPQIAALVASPDADIRVAAVWALGRIGPTAKVYAPAILPMLSAADRPQVSNASLALVNLQPEPATVVPQVIEGMLGASDYLRDHPEVTVISSPQDRATQAAVFKAQNTLIYGEKILSASGPAWGAISKFLQPLPAATGDTTTPPSPGPYSQPELTLLKALQARPPNDPVFIDCVVSLLKQTREAAIQATGSGVTPAREYDPDFNRLRLARLLQAIDPRNADIRQVIREGFAAGPNTPERIWSIDICREIHMSPQELLPPLNEMIVLGTAPACIAAARTAPVLENWARPLAPQLIARIDSRVRTRAPAMIDLTPAIALLPALDPDSPAVAECLIRCWQDSNAWTACSDGIVQLHDPGPLIVETLLGSRPGRQRDIAIDTLRRIGPLAIEAAIPLAEELALTKDHFRQMDILRALLAMGPEPLCAADIASTLSLRSSTFETPERGDLRLAVLGQIVWDAPTQKAIRKYLGDNGLRREAMCSLGPQALPLFEELSRTPGIRLMPPQDRDEAILSMASASPMNISVVAPLAIKHPTKDAALAVINAIGTPGEKADLLVALLNNDDAWACHADAARGLATLRTGTPTVRDALLLRGSASNILAVREACTAAIETLFPPG